MVYSPTSLQLLELSHNQSGARNSILIAHVLWAATCLISMSINREVDGKQSFRPWTGAQVHLNADIAVRGSGLACDTTVPSLTTLPFFFFLMALALPHTSYFFLVPRRPQTTQLMSMLPQLTSFCYIFLDTLCLINFPSPICFIHSSDEGWKREKNVAGGLRAYGIGKPAIHTAMFILEIFQNTSKHYLDDFLRHHGVGPIP